MKHSLTTKGNLAEQVQRNFNDSAYEVIAYVAQNMDNITFIYDVMFKNKVLYCANNLSELNSLNTDVTKFARIYSTENVEKIQYTDYVYIDGNFNGTQPNTTGSWFAVNTSTNITGNPSYGAIPYKYIVQNEVETSFILPVESLGIKEVYVQGIRQHLNDNFWFDPITRKVSFKNEIYKGEQVVLMLVGVEGIPSSENSLDGFSMQTWTYNKNNNGRAIGDGTEELIIIDVGFTNVTNVFLNGIRLAHELDLECKINSDRGGIQLYKPLSKGDIFQVQIGGYFGTRG